MAKRKKVALVLSSGGARGLAHIGVIERLEEEGFEISAIAGASIGSVIGAYYAAGKLDVYKKWVTQLDRLDVFSLFDFTLSANGIMKGDKLFKNLGEIIEDRNIESFDIPFAAVATDIINQKEVVFTKGSMYDAMRASTAIPTVLRPYTLDKTELVDGGVINPLPMNLVSREKGDILVAVNVNANISPLKIEMKENEKPSPKKEEQLYQKMLKTFKDRWNKEEKKPEELKKMGFLDIINRSLDLLQDQLCTAAVEKHKPDILVNISKEASSTFDFYKAKEIIEIGRRSFDIAYEKNQK